VVADWSFARRPFWLFSHLFALTVVTSFVLLGFWQLSRHQQRADLNAVIQARSTPPALDLATALDRTAGELDHQLVEGRGTYVDPDVARVANRSQGGVAGQHLVAAFQLDDGRLLLVNRGFAPLDPSIPVADVPAGEVTVEGWLRASVTRDRFVLAPASASGEGGSGRDATFPDPLDPPATDGGPHLSYMVQWWIFAVLGTGFYGAVLRRQARAGPAGDPEPAVSSHPDTASV
jgi:cytochrome oxidase assembly protein ShyY1